MLSGIANNLSWGACGYGAYLASIPVSGVTTSSIVQSTLTSVSNSEKNILDSLNAWLVNSYCDNEHIYFLIAAEPTQPQNFPIAWVIIKE